MHDFVKTGQSGQVGIIILLVVMVMSTIGISVVSRSSTDVSLSRSGEDANRAFDAAQSGIEQAFSEANALDPNNDDEVTGTIASIPGLTVDYSVEKSRELNVVVDEGASVSLDVKGVASGATLDISWATEDSCVDQTPASLAITVYASPGTSPAYRKIYAGACAQNPSDNFTLAPAGVDPYFRHITVIMQAGDELVRIRPVYNQTKLRAVGVGWSLPVQQFNIVSTAQSNINKETKALRVDRTLPSAPSIFDYALFAGGSISN